MNTAWIEHNGQPINIDPKDGYEAVRGSTRSFVVIFPDQRAPILMKIRHDSAGKTTPPANSKLAISGFVHDYYIVYA